MDKIPALIAKRPILHLAKLYHVGDELPTSDSVMLDAWLDAGSAEWQKDPEEAEEIPVDEQPKDNQEAPADEQPKDNQEAPADEQPENPETIVTDEKADPQTAEPGLPGESGSGEPEELVGKVPKTPERKDKKGAK